MKNFIKTFLIFLTGLVMFLGSFSVAGAQEGENKIDVTFTPETLFSELQILPGDTASASFTVSNVSDETQEIFLLFRQTGDGILGEVIETTLRDDVLLRQDPLSEWFGEEENIGVLASGADRAYDLEATFVEASGNRYENARVDFDVCVGVSGGAIQCAGGDNENNEENEESEAGGDGDAGGSGGGNFNEGTTNTEEESQDGDGDDSGDGEAAGVDAENLDENGSEASTTFIPGASTGQGNALSFNDGLGGDTGAVAGANTDDESSGQIGSGLSTERNDSDRSARSSDENAQVASVFSGLPFDFNISETCWWIFLIILVVIFVLTIIFDRLRGASELPPYARRGTRWTFVDGLFGLATMVAIFIPIPCIVILLALCTGLSSLYFFFVFASAARTTERFE